MRKTTMFVALLVLLCAVSSFAADHPQKPGKWQMKMEMEMPGMPVKMPPVTMEVCVTAEDLADPNKAVPKDPKSDCKVGEYQIDGNKVTWTMECPKQKMKGEGEMTFDGESYSGEMRMRIEDQEMKTKYSGKWMGACTKK